MIKGDTISKAGSVCCDWSIASSMFRKCHILTITTLYNATHAPFFAYGNSLNDEYHDVFIPGRKLNTTMEAFQGETEWLCDFADFLHAQKAALHTKESWKFNIIYLKRNIQTKSHFTSCVYKDMEIIQNMWIGTPLSDTKTI